MKTTCKNEAMVMPENFTAISEDEMTYVDGGAQVYLNVGCLSKIYCTVIAGKYTKATGLSRSRIAKEIYAHAVLYLVGITAAVEAIIYNFHLADSAINYIIKHSNPVDLGGDSAARIAVFNAIWAAGPII